MVASTARCLACGETDLRFWAKAHDVEYKSVPDEFTYLRCLACDALSIDPVPSDRLREIYPPNYYAFVPSSSRRRLVERAKQRLDRMYLRRLVRQVPGAELSALDVGGGAGHVLSTLRSADPRVRRTTIVDFDESAGVEATRNGHRYLMGRIEDVRLEEQFDIALVLNLIEHVADPLAVLIKVRDALKPSGIAVVHTPNYDSLDARIFRDHNWGGYHCPRHWVLFTAAGFMRLAARAGLEVRQLTFTQGAPFWTVSVFAALDHMGLVRITKDRPAWMHPMYGHAASAFALFDFARRPFSRVSQMRLVLTRRA